MITENLPMTCPVCGEKSGNPPLLTRDGNSLRCPKNHCFDISSKGYVNLLLSQHKNVKDPGDSKEMVAARRLFLDSGAYSGETEFLSERTVSEDAAARKTRISRGRSDILMLMSDGVADDYFPAQPMMKRLLLDLRLNGILPMPGDTSGRCEPAPMEFPAVTPEQQPVAVQYSKQLLKDGDDAVNELWDSRDTLAPWSLEAWGKSLGGTPELRLQNWLDNYSERGSFDDRTLVVMEFDDK